MYFWIKLLLFLIYKTIATRLGTICSQYPRNFLSRVHFILVHLTIIYVKIQKFIKNILNEFLDQNVIVSKELAYIYKILYDLLTIPQKFLVQGPLHPNPFEGQLYEISKIFFFKFHKLIFLLRCYYFPFTKPYQ